MIIVRLKGGLGNQMFQYALGKNLSLKHSVELKIDKSFFEDRTIHHSFTRRDYMLDFFNINEPFADDFTLQKLNKTKDPLFDRIIHKISNTDVPYYRRRHIFEKQNSFDDNIFHCPKDCLIEGYWQSEKYFLNIKDLLQHLFEVKTAPTLKNKTTLASMSNTESVAIHFRRKDYIDNPETNQIHGTCSLQYYYDAIDIISSKIKNISLYIFSDDIDWVKNNFRTKYPTVYVDWNYELVYEDFRLLSSCKYFITANSSFSWWAAWLNNNPEKIVIAPKKWFNDSTIDIKDLMPEQWIKI